MEIRPLTAAKESVLTYMNTVRPNVVQQKLQQLRPNYIERAQVKQIRPVQSGNICTHHQTLNVHHSHYEQSSVFGKDTAQGAISSQPVILGKLYESQQPMQVLQTKQEPSSSGGQIANSSSIGLHVGSNQVLAAVHNEYSHFQNVTLQKELADSRTISLDRADMYATSDSNRNTHAANGSSAGDGTRHTILSRKDQTQTYQIGSDRQQHGHEQCIYDQQQQILQQQQSSNEKRNFVNAKIIGSLKSGYGFLPNFSQPNNQGSRSVVKKTHQSGVNSSSLEVCAAHQAHQHKSQHQRQHAHKQKMPASHVVHVVNDLRIFASRSPDPLHIKQPSSSLSPHPTIQRKKTASSKRPTSMDLPPAHSKAHTGTEHGNVLPSDKGDHSVSRTDADAASNSSPKELQQHKYGSNEGDEVVSRDDDDYKVVGVSDEVDQNAARTSGGVSRHDAAGITHMTTNTPELLQMSQLSPQPINNNNQNNYNDGPHDLILSSPRGIQQLQKQVAALKQEKKAISVAVKNAQMYQMHVVDGYNESMVLAGGSNSSQGGACGGIGGGYLPHQASKKDSNIDYNSQSLYERYNKVITSRRDEASPSSPNFNSLSFQDKNKSVKIASPSHTVALMGQGASGPTTTVAAAGPSYKGFKKQRGRFKHQHQQRSSPKPTQPQLQTDERRLSFSPTAQLYQQQQQQQQQKQYGQSGGNQVTILVFKNDREMARGLKAHQDQQTSNLVGTSSTNDHRQKVKKINASGRPIRKTTGRLESLRGINEPEPGQVQLNFPVTRASTLCQSQKGIHHHCSHAQHIKQRDRTNESGQQTSKAKISPASRPGSGSNEKAASNNKTASDEKKIAQFEVIKSVEQIINFTDTASEGTNRMSAAHLKLKQSKSTKKSGSPTVQMEQTGDSHVLKDSQATFEPDVPRRSLEILQKNSKNKSPKDRQNSKSKSIDSAGAVSTLHDMLKPKGIEVHSQSIAATHSIAATTSQDPTTPKNGHSSLLKAQLSNIVETKRERKHSEFTNALPSSQNEKLTPAEKIQMTFEKRNSNGTEVPFINFGQMKSQDAGEVITANLASSNSYRGASVAKEISINKDVDEGHSKDTRQSQKRHRQLLDENGNIVSDCRKDQHQIDNNDSQTSILSSIKTSIDDETLMELAKEGIQARTPTNRKKNEEIKIQTQGLQNTIEKHRSELLSAPDTPESHGAGIRIHLNSTLQEKSQSNCSLKQSGHSKNQLNSDKNAVSSAYAVASTGGIQVDENISNVNHLTQKSSQRSIIYQQSPGLGIKVGSIIQHHHHQYHQQPMIQVDHQNAKIIDDMRVEEKDASKRIFVSSLDTPVGCDTSSPGGKNSSHQAGQKSIKSKQSQLDKRLKDNLTFTAVINKKNTLPINQKNNKKIKNFAKGEAMSQTDFPPLPPLDPTQFSIANAMQGNYDTNLMFAMPQEADVSMLHEFSIAGQMTSMEAIQPESMLGSNRQDDQVHHSAMQMTGHTPIQYVPQEPVNYLQSAEPQYVGNPDQNSFKLDMNNISQIQTDQIVTQLTTASHMALHSLDGIKFVKIQKGEINTGSPTVGMFDQSAEIQPSKIVRSDQHGHHKGVIMQAASRGQRIIMTSAVQVPKVMNMRIEEQHASPEKHHLISLQGQSLQVVKLEDRNQQNSIKRAGTLKQIQKLTSTMHGIRGAAALQKKKDLTKNFRRLSQNLMGQHESVEGVDKSIGEDTSHSSGSFTNKRKYYILNIDNPNEEQGIQIAYNKSSRSKIQSKTKLNEREKILLKHQQQHQQHHNNQQQLHHHHQEMIVHSQQPLTNNNSILSKTDYPTIMEQKSNQELDIADGILTDRHHHDSSSNDKAALGQMQSARNNQTQSRQEDLDTVYLASTMQFNKDLQTTSAAGNRKIGHKSPDLQLKTNEVAAFVSEKSQNSTEKINEDEILTFSKNQRERFRTITNVGKRNTHLVLPTHSQNISTERRQIQLKNGQPVDVMKPASPTLSNEIRNQRLSGKKRQNSQNQEVLRGDQRFNLVNGNSLIGDVRTQQLSIAGKEAHNNQPRLLIQEQIAIRDESVARSGGMVTREFTNNSHLQKKTATHRGGGVVSVASANDSTNLSQHRRANIKSPLSKTIEGSVSTASLEKLYHPVAAIQVNKSRQLSPATQENNKLHPADSTTANQSDFRKVRPKTSENARSQLKKGGLKGLGGGDDNSPRNRKIIYLMHKRREIALRRTRQNTATSGKDIIGDRKQTVTSGGYQMAGSGVPGGATSAAGEKESFFNKVSQQLSRVFSLDRTSTRVATTLTRGIGVGGAELNKNSQQNISSAIHQSHSLARTSQPTRAQARHQNNLIQLTINPCSNATLQPSNTVNLRPAERREINANGSLYGGRTDQGNFNVISEAIISPFIHQSIEANTTNEYHQRHLRTATEEHYIRYDTANNAVGKSAQYAKQQVAGGTVLVETNLLEQRQRKRAGLKTAEGNRNRMRQYLTNPHEQFKKAAVLSNASIDINNKFKGFDRRQTHDDMLKMMQNKRQTNSTKRNDGAINTLDSQGYQLMLSNQRLNPTLLEKRDQVFSARLKKPLQTPISNTTIVAPPKKQRTKSTRINKKKSLSTQHQASFIGETGKNEKESCHRDSFAQLIREDPITEAHMQKKLDSQSLPKTASQSFSQTKNIQAKHHKYQRKEEIPNTITGFPFSFGDFQHHQHNRIRVNTMIHASDSATEADLMGGNVQTVDSKGSFAYSQTNTNNKSQNMVIIGGGAGAGIGSGNQNDDSGSKPPGHGHGKQNAMLKTENRTRIRRLHEAQMFNRNQKDKMSSKRSITQNKITNMMIGNVSGSVFSFDISPTIQKSQR